MRNHQGWWLGVSLLVSCFIMGVMGHNSAQAAVGHQKVKIGSTWVSVVTANLNSPDVVVTPALARGGIGGQETFTSMMKRLRPAAAIDGTFFCTRSLKPTGDIVIDKQLVWQGCLGTAIGIRNGREISFVQSKDVSAYKWHDYDQVMVAGPALVLGGRTVVSPRSEGFKSSVHFTRRTRAAIGKTWSNKLVLVTTTRGLLLSELATVMKRLNCSDAAALDGGSSTGLYCNGKLLAKPTRTMTNCLLVYASQKAYAAHKGQLVPKPAFARIEPRYPRTDRPNSGSANQGG